MRPEACRWATRAAGTSWSRGDNLLALCPRGLTGWQSSKQSTSDKRRCRIAVTSNIGRATTLFENIQQSDATPNEFFTLGLTGGDANNTLTGSLTGTLIAGREYQLFFDAFTQSQPTAGGSATASGFFRLTFVPEPSTLLLATIGLLGLGWYGWRRRKS